MTLVVRANYSQESFALLGFLNEHREAFPFKTIYVVYIETGWGGEHWESEVEKGEAFAAALGFIPIRLTSTASFETLVQDRGSFPSQKFQWCAGMLKGIPLINWLDEHDPEGQWVVALPKRQVLMRTKVIKEITECPYHGDRKVIHPILEMTDEACDLLLQRFKQTNLHKRSLECEPCINLCKEELAEIKISDLKKTAKLENSLGQNMFPATRFGGQTGIKAQVDWAKSTGLTTTRLSRDHFNRGCGDPFGCGL